MEENFDTQFNCLVVCTAGQSSRMTRKFLRKLYEDYNLRSGIFTDADAFGFRIAASIVTGSIKTSHISDLLCVPGSVHIGLFPSQIEKYDIPTDKITQIERENLKIMIEDPKFKKWTPEIELMLKSGKKSEQQAFSYYGLDYVTKTYLPEVLKHYNFI